MNIYTVIKGHWDKEKTLDQKDLFNSRRRTKGMTAEVLPKYVFRVDVRANKHQIRQAVEKLFAQSKVKVAKVNTAHVPGKTKRSRTTQAGKTSDWKKAVVTLKEGKIEY